MMAGPTKDGARGRQGKARRAKKPSPPRETRAARAARVVEIIRRLREAYPGATCSLEHANPYQLLVATILSAQCTDERVNMVTPALFRRYPTVDKLADARPAELEEMIKSTGFFRNKTKSLLGMANAVVERHHGRVPADMDELTALPGVGRKTANVVLGNAFHKNIGIVVDTHVRRLGQRLGLSGSDDPEQIERDLMEIVPRDDWTDISHLLIFHGRAICVARKPRCGDCMLADICPSAFIV
jgi:endonuclease-3